MAQTLSMSRRPNDHEASVEEKYNGAELLKKLKFEWLVYRNQLTWTMDS